MSIEIEDILQDRPAVVFAADQKSFQPSGRAEVFCVLVPLMTLDGHPVSDLESNFPDRGRVWWLLRHELRSVVVRPGTLWTGKVEQAVKRDKDSFQVVPNSVSPGASGWVEVIDVPEADPDVQRLCSNRGIPFDRQPLKRVFVRGRKFSYGPFLATHRASTDTLDLRAPSAGDPIVHRLPTTDLKALPTARSFRFVSCEHDPHAGVQRLQIALIPEASIERLLENGQIVDAQSEAQLIKWALGIANYTNRDRSEFRAALGALPETSALDDPRSRERLERFRRLCSNSDSLQSLGADVASALAESEPLRDMVSEHVASFAHARIEEEVRKSRDQIDRQTEQARTNKDRADEELRKVEEDIEAKRCDAEARLKRENAEWLRTLKEREERIDAQEAELGKKEMDIELRLREVIGEYRDHADEITTRVLTYLPMLRPWDPAARQPTTGRILQGGAMIEKPSYLAERLHGSSLDQTDFVDQLRRVVERRGFVFHDDDLINFHISLLVGVWTVVAGPTGVGKSSLPRLYAEALGMKERYLKIPVQPDWLDDRDVLGAFNSLSERFEPAATGLVHQLIYAQQDAGDANEGTYLICLDEMNLSRVEHYFARFLSILEDPPPQRCLTLLSPGVGSAEDPFSAYRQITIGPNVRLVGTVNVDETTHFFSPKVLDRASLLTMEDPDLTQNIAGTTRASDLVVQPIPFQTWSSWAKRTEDAEPAQREFVLRLNDTLRCIQSGLGFRLRDRILAFVATARELLEPDRAMDLAICQTVLPRIRTHHAGFSAATEQLLRQMPPERFPKSGRILEALRASDGSHDFFQLL